MGMTKMGVAAIFETRGNDDCHVILRGGKAPNYDAAERGGELRRAARGRPARAGDDRRLARQQRQAARSARSRSPTTSPAQIAAGERRIIGVMIESHLEAGRQDLVPGVPLQARRVDHRRLHRLRPDRAGAALARRGGRGTPSLVLSLARV